MDFPPYLRDEVFAGRVVLCLGAGASVGATTPAGGAPPDARTLRDRLSERFLGGAFKAENLAYVAELAISETDFATVQDYIADLFRDLRPAPFHMLLPSFRWRALVTTNFDTLIEDVYHSAKNPQQALVPFISNSDRVDERIRTRDSAALVKLHGCITRTHEDELRLILTVDQYNRHRKGRSLLFNFFTGLASEYPVVFVGQKFQDSDLRALVAEASDNATRPRFFLVRPGITPPESRFLESQRITPLAGTFAEFLEGLDRELPPEKRGLSVLVSRSHPIERFVSTHSDLDANFLSFLTDDVDFVHQGMPIVPARPQTFYKGFDLGWYPIANDLDVRRRLTDMLLRDVIHRPEADRPTNAELYAVLAEAGSGKTVLLRRVAWEGAADGNALCLFAKPHGLLQLDKFVELHRLTSRRTFLFVDNAADYLTQLSELLAGAIRFKLPLTIITAERQSTWNQYCERLNERLSDSFQLHYLSEADVGALVTLLERHDSLGPNLQSKSRQERITQFTERAGRQLLVALHEATLGVPFEDIIEDEFTKVYPPSARSLYLTVCVLNRLGVPVRAGLISRVHGIRFEDFRKDLFGPLEHVVNVTENQLTGDYYYVARHPEIAQIVFERALRNPVDRYNEYIRILRNLNILYSTDRSSFRGMLRAKALLDLFPSHDDVSALFSVANEVAPDDAFVLQQMANYERRRPNGNLEKAERLLTRARELDPRDPTITHTLAEVMRSRAESSDNPLKRSAFRAEAKKLLRTLTSEAFNARYAYSTLLKVAIDELRELSLNPDSTEHSLDAAVRDAEMTLARGLQRYPDDAYLLNGEAELAQLIDDHQRVFHALRRAHEANPRDPFVAVRLARVLEARGKHSDACDVVKVALDGNRGDKVLNFRYAMLLRVTNRDDTAALTYHFNRAFTKWDTNYEAQFWFARYAFEAPEPERRRDSVEVFRRLREAPISNDVRVCVRDVVASGGVPRLFVGTIVRCEEVYGFVAPDGMDKELFFHRDQCAPGVWQQIRRHGRIRFRIGFSYSGPKAVDLEVL